MGTFFCLLRSKSQTKQTIVDNVDDDDRKEGSVGNKVGGKCLVQVAVEGGACTLPCTAEGGLGLEVEPTIPLCKYCPDIYKAVISVHIL